MTADTIKTAPNLASKAHSLFLSACCSHTFVLALTDDEKRHSANSVTQLEDGLMLEQLVSGLKGAIKFDISSS